MEHKKKYHGGVSILLVLLFSIFLGCYSSCYAGVDDDFSQQELDQINTFFGTDVSLSHLNNAYSRLKSYYSDSGITINKLNVLFQYCYLNNNSYIYYITLFANNGTFNNSLDYLCFYNTNNTDYVKTITDINDTANRSIHGQYIFKYKNGSFDSNSSTGNLTSPIHAYYSPYVINGNFFSSPNLLTSVRTQTFYFYDNNNSIKSYFSSNYINLDGYTPVDPEPEEPSGDTSGDTPISPSGEGGGSGTPIDYTNQLNNINNNIIGITNQISGDTTKILDNQNQNTQTIVNSISGETNKITNTLTEPAVMDNTNITSGDILENFSFMADPYSNFWWDFIDGVELALLGSVRQLPVNWLGYNGYFNLDGLINYPTSIKNILTTVSTVAVVWIMLKWWKVIMDKLTSGDVDEVLEILEEQGKVNITNLF